MKRTDRAILRALLALGGAGTVGDIRTRLGVTGYTILDKRHSLEGAGYITTREVQCPIDMGTMHGVTPVTMWCITDAGRAALGERSVAV